MTPAQHNLHTSSRTFSPRTILSGLVFAALISLTCVAMAQTAATPSSGTKTVTHRPIHKKKKPVVQEAPPVAETKPVEEPKPAWPINDPATKPQISWDSKGLRVDAANSSLKDILDEITLQTGIKVEGYEKDRRIFGVYGPGRARDVLSQLLDGTGYNVLMIGEQAPGTPRQVVLTARSNAPVTKSNDPNAQQQARINIPTDDDNDVVDNTPQPEEPMRPGMQNQRGQGGRIMPNIPGQNNDQQPPNQQQPNQPQ